MTIRYECPECSAVMKIKPEKAGQQGKCPKCKFEFTIPEESPAPEPVLVAEDLVDMPREVTPAVVLPRQTGAASDEFDPMGVLNSDSASGGVSGGPGAGDIKPSVADLMREHQEKKAREEAKRIKRQQKKNAINPLLSDLETSGSAADAITRTYERKREESSDAAPLSRDERRAKEERAAFLRFVLQTSAVAVLVIGFAWGLFSYVLSSPGAEVVGVTGRVTAKGQPLSGYRIQFTPIQAINGPELEGNTSSARITGSGDFTLLYDPQTPGAIVGLHRVVIEDAFGLKVPVPPEFAEVEVTEDPEKNVFEFNF